MDFLNKLQKWLSGLSRKKKKQNFSEMIRQEKKQTYLFRDEEGNKYQPARNKKKTIFGKTTGNHKNTKDSNSLFYIFPNALKTFRYKEDFYYVMGGIGLLLISLTAYIILFSPYFKISPNKVLIQPQTTGIDIGIAYRSIEGVYGENIFLLDEKKIAQEIKENLKNSENIRIDKLYPNGIKIMIKSLPVEFDTSIYGIDNKRWGMSSNGVLVPIADLKENELGKHLEIISSDLKNEIFLSYKKILQDRTIFLISKIFEIFSSEWSDLEIARGRYFFAENELHVVLESNTKIILSLQEEDNQEKNTLSNNLIDELITLKTYIANNRDKILDGSITYIDARIPGKLFICANNQEQCNNNLILVYGNAYQ